MPGPVVALIIFSLLLLSAIFSGLNLGLYSLNRTDLERKAELGNNQAARVG